MDDGGSFSLSRSYFMFTANWIKLLRISSFMTDFLLRSLEASGNGRLCHSNSRRGNWCVVNVVVKILKMDDTYKQVCFIIFCILISTSSDKLQRGSVHNIQHLFFSCFIFHLLQQQTIVRYFFTYA